MHLLIVTSKLHEKVTSGRENLVSSLFEGQPITVRNAWQQYREKAGHIVSNQEAKK